MAGIFNPILSKSPFENLVEATDTLPQKVMYDIGKDPEELHGGILYPFLNRCVQSPWLLFHKDHDAGVTY